MKHGPAWTRRAALGLAGAGVAAAVLPSRALAAGEDAGLRGVLDGLPQLADPAARLAALGRFDPARLSRRARLDLLTVRFALDIEAKLAALPAQSPSRYPLQLALACGADIAPADAKRRLEVETVRLEGRADALFGQIGMTRGTVGERFRALLEMPRFTYPDSDAGRDAAVSDMNRWLGRVSTALPRWFEHLPPQCLDVAARRLSASEIAEGKGGFRILPTPTSRGFYVVDLRDIARRPSWTLHSVVHHELLPGHMMQLPMQRLSGVHPLRLHYTPGYTEGWAVHAEYLAWQGGLVEDPHDQLGAVHWLLFRTTRGLADLALNGEHRSTKDVVAMLQVKLGFPAYFAPFRLDLEKIGKAPGLRVAEALTALQLGEGMRQSRNLRRFHAAMLADGPRPLRLITSFATG